MLQTLMYPAFLLMISVANTINMKFAEFSLKQKTLDEPIDMEESFVCRRCGYTTCKKYNLEMHLKRKRSCQASLEDISREDLLTTLTDRQLPEKTYDCKQCGKQFASASGRSHHHKVCKVQKQEGPTQKTIEELHAKLVVMERELQELKDNRSPTHITHNHNHGTINITTINAFGRENIDHMLDHPNFNQFMELCLKQQRQGIIKFIEKKHFDPLHPENHNFKKMNKKDNFIEVYNGRTWELKDKEDALELLFVNIQAAFANYVDANITSDKARQRMLQNFMRNVGKPLDWDLDNDNFTFEGELSEKDIKDLRRRMYLLGYEYIYRRSKELFSSQGT